MTGPVIRRKQEDGWLIEFVLSTKFNETKPPVPLNPKVEQVKIIGYKAVALKYGESLSEQKINAQKEKLLNLLSPKGLQPNGIPLSTGYDPPWTRPFLRKNEITVAIK